eukprot:2017130-Rhodomonas_salina.3
MVGSPPAQDRSQSRTAPRACMQHGSFRADDAKRGSNRGSAMSASWINTDRTLWICNVRMAIVPERMTTPDAELEWMLLCSNRPR